MYFAFYIQCMLCMLFVCTSHYQHSWPVCTCIYACIYIIYTSVPQVSMNDITITLKYNKAVIAVLVAFLTLSARAQEGYGTCLVCLFVCLSVCYHLIVDIVHFYGLSKVHTALFKAFLHFTAWIFEKNFRSKVMARKANMQMSSYRSQPVLAHFEYRAYISRYLQAVH